MQNYFIKAGYVARTQPEYTEDTKDDGLVWQPDVYGAAAALAERHRARTIIDIGCGGGRKLAQLAGRFDVVGIDFGSNIDHCRAAYPFGRWITVDLDGPDGTALTEALLSLGTDVLEHAVIVCSDVIEHLVHPEGLLTAFARVASLVRALVISTPERDLTHGGQQSGPPPNPCHVREWSLDEFRRLLDHTGMPVLKVGLTPSHNAGWPRCTILAIIDRLARPVAVPAERPVTALLITHNNADLIDHTLNRLLADGIRVHAIDLGSADGTVEALTARKDSLAGLSAVDAPLAPHPDKPAGFWRYVEDIARRYEGHWLLLLEGSQLMEPTCFGPSLRAALAAVEARGFNTIGLTALDFHAMNTSFHAGMDVDGFFRVCSFAKSASSLFLRRAWIQPAGSALTLSDTMGCSPLFPGRRDFPYRFILRNLPKRRASVSDPHLLGAIAHEQTWSFPPAGEKLIDYRRPDFQGFYMTECLLGVGVLRYDLGV